MVDSTLYLPAQVWQYCPGFLGTPGSVPHSQSRKVAGAYTISTSYLLPAPVPSPPLASSVIGVDTQQPLGPSPNILLLTPLSESCSLLLPLLRLLVASSWREIWSCRMVGPAGPGEP